MDSKHTPGPWEWFEDALYPKYVIDAKIRSRETDDYEDNTFWSPPIVETDGGHYGPERMDRYLIATAPDLLAALKALDAYWLEDFPGGPEEPDNIANPLTKLLRGGMHPTTIAIWKQIRAAIAKAEGQ